MILRRASVQKKQVYCWGILSLKLTKITLQLRFTMLFVVQVHMKALSG